MCRSKGSVTRVARSSCTAVLLSISTPNWGGREAEEGEKKAGIEEKRLDDDSSRLPLSKTWA